MAKIEIDIEPEQLERIERIAAPFGLGVEDWAGALVRSLLALDGERPGVEVAIRAGTITLEIGQDRALVLEDLLRRLESAELPSQSPIELDEAQAEVVHELQEAIAGELGEEPEEYLELARRSSERRRNWLDVKDIECGSCSQALGWQLRSPFHDSLLLGCNRCPRSVEISYYDPVYEQITTDLAMLDLSDEEYQSAYRARFEESLHPCPCGGAFRFEAPRRCPTCEAELPPRLDDVGEYFGRGAWVRGEDAGERLLKARWKG